jgi:hypothetical protein
MNVSAAIAASGKVSNRLPNSITVSSQVCPAEIAATTLVAVHRGQSGRPSLEELSRTAAPVQTRTAFAITEASASPRTESRVGRSTGAEKPTVTMRAPESCVVMATGRSTHCWRTSPGPGAGRRAFRRR